jgi:hypothetical protein
MKDAVVVRYTGIYVLGAVTSVSLFVSPFNSIDPVSLPKLCLLVVLSFISAGFAFSHLEFFRVKKNMPLVLTTGIFILQLILVFLLDKHDIAFKFYGTFGRNTGFLAYLSLNFLLIASAVSATKDLLKKYAAAIIVTGILLAVYGIAQNMGYDFYQFSNNYSTNVFGTFGNPNFQSAFMGVSAAATMTFAGFGRMKIYFRALLFIVTLLTIFNISVSSQQGYLNFAAGMIAAVFIFLLKSRKQMLGWIIIVSSSLLFSLLLLGIFDTGPLAAIIYKTSLQARGFYWRAAIHMMIEHPFFGVGMDGFGDAYFRARTREIASINAGIYSDSAHSIPLDIGSNGGLPLFIAYMSIIVLVLISIMRVIKRDTSFDVVFTAIVAAWVAYQAQSLISINQLGLGVWGWSLSGLIIGYELNSRSDEKSISQKSVQKGNAPKQKIAALAVVLTFIATGAGITIALPPYVAAGKFYKALESGNPKEIQLAAYLKPYDRMRFLYVAQALQENKFESNAINVLRDASKIYPDSIDIWRRWAGILSADPADIAHAKAEMKRLDPYNPDLK